MVREVDASLSERAGFHSLNDSRGLVTILWTRYQFNAAHQSQVPTTNQEGGADEFDLDASADDHHDEGEVRSLVWKFRRSLQSQIALALMEWTPSLQCAPQVNALQFNPISHGSSTSAHFLAQWTRRCSMLSARWCCIPRSMSALARRTTRTSVCSAFRRVGHMDDQYDGRRTSD